MASSGANSMQAKMAFAFCLVLVVGLVVPPTSASRSLLGDKYPAGVKSCEDIQEWGAKACPTDAKYTYCISGNAHNGCRHIEDGPFPKVDCTKSCISHNYL